MKLWPRLVLTLIITISISACTSRTTVRLSSDYADILTKSNELSLLPTKSTIRTADAGFKEVRMYEYESYIEPIIDEILRDAFIAKGYRIASLRKKDLKDKQLYKDVAQLRNVYDAIYPGLTIPARQELKFAYNLNANIMDKGKTLAEKTGKDIVILANYGEYVKTTGARVRDFMLDMLINTGQSQMAEKASLAVGIVNAKTGKILWFNQRLSMQNWMGSAIDNFSSDDKTARKIISKLVKYVLKELPNKADLHKNIEEKR